jgi:uncharacterized protein YdhG (YjbR/CyaY superfamily)
MNDDKISMGLRQVNVKDAQIRLQKTITWTKNQEREARACVKSGLSPRKSKTLVKTRLQSKSLCFKNVLNSKNHPSLLWHAKDNDITSMNS